MNEYNISAVYSVCVHVGKVKANNEEEAKEKAEDLGIADGVITVCHHCSKEIGGELLYEDGSISAEEVK